MLQKKISLNEAVADLANDTYRLLFTWAIPHLDIKGRIDGSARKFRAIVCPLLDHVTPDTVEDFLSDAIGKGLIERYEAGSVQVVQYPKFTENQKLNPDREAQSRFPDPHQTTPELVRSKSRSTQFGKKSTQDEMRPEMAKNDDFNPDFNITGETVTVEEKNQNQETPQNQPPTNLLLSNSGVSPANSPLSLSLSKRNKLPSPFSNGGENGFDAFWMRYPRKVGKKAALAKWKALKRSGHLPPLEKVLAAVESQKTWDQWQRDEGQFIPHPTTWLNEGRWDDQKSEGGKIWYE
jgi:hypothetical protein